MAAVPTHLRDLVDEVHDAVSCGESVAINGRSTRTILDLEHSGRVADRVVSAPSGVFEFQPDEMTVRCGAGTTLGELDAVLAAHSQYVNLPGTGTVGGALARGWTSVDRLGRGPVRDVPLESLLVDHRGRLIRLGGPTVKNVTGFDLLRVTVGALGTLGFFGELTLRTRPRAIDSRWFTLDDVDVRRLTEIHTGLYRPSSVLWDGRRVWIHLEGHPADIDDTVARLGLDTTDEPSTPPHRWSMSPAAALQFELSPGDMVEVGVGLVHRREPAPPRPTPVLDVHRRLDEEFDPDRRLNPQIRRFGDGA